MRRAIPRPCLVLITDRTKLTPNWTLAQAVAPAVTGGVDLVVLREADLPATPRLSVARFLLDGIDGRVPLLTSGDPQFALDSGADGVLVEEPGRAQEARAVIGPEAILGVPLASADSAADAQAAEADFALLNLDWTDSAAALDVLRRIRGVTEIPLIVGVDMAVEVVRECIGAGANGVAICEAGMSAYNRTEAARAYADAIRFP